MRARLLILVVAALALLPLGSASGATPIFDGFCTVTHGPGGVVLRLSGYNVLPACYQMAHLAGSGSIVRRETTPRAPVLMCIRRHNGQLLYVWTPPGFPLALAREACTVL